MDAATRQYFETYFDLFQHDGWAVFVNEISNNKDVINSIESINDVETLNFRKGQLHVFNAILNFANTVELAYQSNETTDDAEG